MPFDSPLSPPWEQLESLHVLDEDFLTSHILTAAGSTASPKEGSSTVICRGCMDDYLASNDDEDDNEELVKNNSLGIINTQEAPTECTPIPSARNQQYMNAHTRKRASSVRVGMVGSLEVLSPYFCMPIEDAAKQLGVGVTALKRKCRECGVSRWPHRKIKSLDTLIHTIKDNAQVLIPEDLQHQAVVVAQALQEERDAIQRSPDSQLHNHTIRLRQASFKSIFRMRRQQQPQSQAIS